MAKKKDLVALKKQKAELKKRKKRKIIIIVCSALLALGAIALSVFLIMRGANGRDYAAKLNERLALLHDKAFSNSDIESDVEGSIRSKYADCEQLITFISICDTKERATVICGTGDSVEESWASASEKALSFVKKGTCEPVWVKADIVNDIEQISSEELPELVADYEFNEFFRKGIAFDSAFETAFLEAEVNGNKLFDYKDTRELNLKNINEYLARYNRKELKEIPDKLYIFTCLGYIYDGGEVYELYSGDTLNYGRRIIENVDDEYVNTLIYSASQFLSESVLSNGQFIYGWYPTYDKQLTDYNILRHAGTIWSLVNQYRTTGDESLIEKIDLTLDYLLSSIETEGDISYVIERKSDEVKLGGNGVAIVALADYMEVFETDKYVPLVRTLANGILTMLDIDTGEYWHVLNYPDYSRKEEYRTVYYDGEATFALSKAYGLTGEYKYLDAACSAVEHFIDADYTQYRDHWVAYAVNEVTKYVPDERYFEFGLRNANENLDIIYKQETSYHTYMELLVATFELYDRIVTNNIDVSYLAVFDAEYFFDTIFHRADHMLNGYFYPEYAMYLKNPARILDTFFVRHDGYRVRIDDVQHFVGGYYVYSRSYDKLCEYRDSFSDAE